MFTWICPKCGGEGPPAYSEGPRVPPQSPAPAEPVGRIDVPPAAPAPPAYGTPQSAPAFMPWQPPTVTPVAPPPPSAPVPAHEGQFNATRMGSSQFSTPQFFTAAPPQTPPPQSAPQPQYNAHAAQYDAPAAPPPLTRTSEPPQPYAPVSSAPETRKLPPALVAAGTTLGMVALLALLYVYVLPHRGDSAVKAQTPALSTAPLKPSTGTHPMAKYLELNGIRIQESKAGRARIDFVVVNHSSADLPKMVMDVTLRSADRDFFN